MNSHNVYELSRSFYVAFDARLWKYFLGAAILSYSDIIPPKGSGFYCDDQSITFPYQGDSITSAQIITSCLVVPIFFILPVELVKRWKRCGSVTSNLLSVWPPSWRVWRAALLGNVMLMAPVEFLKNIFSEARPHFLDSCKPNITEEMCRTGFVVEFNCTSSFSTRMILDAQKSFPSGHATLAVFTALFMMWYLSRALQESRSYLTKSCVQLFWAAFAFVSCLTRITDRRHHWWDVVGGSVLGLFAAVIVVQAMSLSIRWNLKDESDGSHSSNKLHMEERSKKKTPDRDEGITSSVDYKSLRETLS